MHILEINNLSKQFSTQKAVNNISFHIEKGSIFGLLGPNGAGKTTLLRMITGIFYPDQGEILFNGKKFDPLNDIEQIGYMPEERGLYKKMKIGEQVLYLARLKNLSKKDALDKAKTWFTKLGMESWWDKKMEDLSKGMSQKLQFVTTVMHEPKLIILDEPFSGLDPVNANLIKDEIFNLAKSGATVIFSTHRMEQVEEICDKIILVNKGEKILDGSVQEVKQQFKENIFSIDLQNEDNDTFSDSPFTIVDQTGGKLLIQKDIHLSSNEVLQYFIQRNKEIHSFHEVFPSLNDIFIKLVEGTASARQFQKS
jgi:ABC-2 type transport system ATP-binding protein